MENVMIAGSSVFLLQLSSSLHILKLITEWNVNVSRIILELDVNVWS